MCGTSSGGGCIQNKHSTDVESPPPPPPPRACISIPSKVGHVGTSDIGRVLVLNDPSVRRSAGIPFGFMVGRCSLNR